MRIEIKIVLAAIIYTVIAEIVNTLSSIATMSYYYMQDYFSVWSKLMMPGLGPPPMEFYYASIAFAFITGLLITIVYNIIKSGIPGEGMKKGLWYGLILFLVAGIPGMLMMFLLINLPVALLSAWAISGLIVYLLGGIVIERLLR